MKVQKLGLVLSVNMAAACLMMQGCKAVKDGNTPLPPDTTVVVNPQPQPAQSARPVAATPAATASAVGQDYSQQTPATMRSGVSIEPAPAVQPALPAQPAPAVQPAATVVPPPPPQPSRVAVVKPLPPVPVKAHAAPAAAHAAPAAGAKAAAPAASDGFVYTVKPGDQLYAVSRRYNVRLASIAKANPGLNVDRIRIGQKIVIPGVAAEPAPAAVASAKPEQQKPQQPAVMNATAVSPTAASITPPAKGGAQATPAAVKTTSAAGGVKTSSSFKPYTGPTKEYKVRSGDSLGRIAYDAGISIRALKEMNKLTKDNLRIGQVLLVPAEKVAKPAPAAAGKKPVETKEVPKTKPVETKDKPVEAKDKPIEAKDAVEVKETVKVEEKPVDAPVKAEEKPVEEKSAGEPAPALDEKAGAAAPAQPPAADSGNTYVVKEGDDLVSVSINCGVSPSQLMDLNGLKAGDGIKPGQVLKLPAHATRPDAR